jgi:hypothetical protein
MPGKALLDVGIINKYSNILVGLWQGFPCGLEEISLACTFIPCNHYNSQEDEDFGIIKYTEELALSRILHGYEPEELFFLIGHF